MRGRRAKLAGLLVAAGLALPAVVGLLAARGSGSAPDAGLAGDANCDGGVDSVDALFVLRDVAGLGHGAQCVDRGDVNCDGAVDSIDALGILRHVARLPPLASPSGCPPIGSSMSPTPTPSPGETPAPTPTPGSTASATPTPAPTPAGAPAPRGYRLTPALPAADFGQMLGFAVVPGQDAAVIITQDGFLWRVALGGGAATPFGDISDRIITSSEEGLLGIAFSPEFETDGRVYLYYSAGEPRRSVLSRFQVSGGVMDANSEHVVLEVPQPYANHNGGAITFGPDGDLYVALGDGGGGGDPEETGQDISDLLGSILRIDVSGPGYTVPPDNPFAGTAGARGEVYAYGLRNPWRFSFDRATGQLWAGDVGQGDWEEVDRILAGGNYGWDDMEGPVCFEKTDCNPGDYRSPRAVYGHGEGDCSVIGGYVYRGPSLPELNGWYVYGDFCSGRVWAVNTAGSSPAVLLADTDLKISSFGELPDGELLVVTFDEAVYRLERRP